MSKSDFFLEMLRSRDHKKVKNFIKLDCYNNSPCIKRLYEVTVQTKCYGFELRSTR